MIDRRIPIENIYYLLCYAFNYIEEQDRVNLDSLQGLERIHDLLGSLLAMVTSRLIRRGLDRGYQEVHEDLSVIRGKINVGATVKRTLRTRGQVACEYEVLSRDVIHNRILYATLRSLLRIPDLHPEVRAQVHGVYSKLNGITEISLSRQHFQQVQLDRNRSHYRFLLELCRLIHENLSVNEQSGEITFTDFTEERMNELYEKFIIEFYRREQDRYKVNRRRKIDWHDEGTSERSLQKIPQMKADVVLEAPERRIIMDAKYYQEALSGQYGSKLRSGHLYQLLAYLRNREATDKPGAKHDGILLYPTVEDSINIAVCLEGHPIQAQSIDLSKNWQNIHDRMLTIIGLDSTRIAESSNPGS